ncbi:minor tail protein [Gordonia phage Coeur]|uniref:Minor tail protein n=1 Tax=Gordonia phage Coeur TaxID=2571246 RepID=A0A4Y6EPR3_9CAUD|nr:tail completion or Neck1 protein [Gordonia phage Coeur]QDF17429.1 minor tail protein [Gordonia phage Coeur]WNO26673.1 minor tail protein [Gordonia phage Rahul]
MATVRVVVVGARTTRAGLDRARRQVARLDRPTREATRAVADLAARLAPKRTTRLARGNRPRVAGNVGQVINRVRYAPYVEYGTEHMHEQPFMRPAARLADVTTPFEDHVDRAIRHL